MDGRNNFVGLNRATGYGYDWSFNGHGGGSRGTAWNSDDDEVTRGTGFLYQEVLPGAFVNAGFRATLDAVSSGDGLAQTIAFSENLDATRWGTTNVSEMAFIVPLQDAGSPQEVDGANVDNGLGPDPALEGPKDLALAYDPARLPYDTFPFANARINAFVGNAAEGLSPRPSSYHPGLVNVIFGDGHARNVSESIDIGVYLRLVSSRGERHGQFILSDNDF